MTKTRTIFKILAISGIILSAGFFWARARAADDVGNINVSFSVTSTTAIVCGDSQQDPGEACDLGNHCACQNGICCSACQIVSDCGGGGDTSAPSISNIQTVVSETSATTTWTAEDGSLPINCSFYFGPSNTAVNDYNEGSSFFAPMTGLLPGTIYSFSFTCSDNAGNTSAAQPGSFTTAGVAQPFSIVSSTVTPGVNSIFFDWSTNRVAVSGQVAHGQDTNYGGTANGVAGAGLSYSASATDLLSCTIYYYNIIASEVANPADNQKDNRSGSTTTLREGDAPGNISPVLTTTTGAITLQWSNPSEPDYLSVRIYRGTNLLYSGIQNSFTEPIDAANCGESMCYMLKSVDRCGNLSGGTEVCGSTDCAPPHCGNGTLQANEGEQCDPPNATTTCSAIDARFVAGVATCDALCRYDVSGCSEQIGCGNGLPDPGEQCDDGSANGACPAHCNTDCTLNNPADCIPTGCGNGITEIGQGEQCDFGADNGACPNICSLNCQWNYICGLEICANGIDDDNNGLTDCADPICAGDPSCVPPPPQCNDGVDNDNDGLIDFPADAGCVSADDNDEYTPEVCTASSCISSNDLIFSAGNRKIRLWPVAGHVTSMSNSTFTVSLRRQSLANEPESVDLRIGDNVYSMIYDSADSLYVTDLSFPGVGTHDGFVKISFPDGTIDEVGFGMISLPMGSVTDNIGNRVPGVNIELYGENGQSFDAGYFAQSNPITTDFNGLYGWVVPNGRYFLTVDADNYYFHKTQLFTVDNNVVNAELSVVLRPIELKDVIPANFALAVQAIKETARNPIVQQTAQKVASPAAAAVVGVGAAAVISWADFLSWLQFLFFQPILFFNRRKRIGWGQVYNSLSKLPIDLATVRLVDAVSGKIVQSHVTDKNGRYLFIVNPGVYRMEVFRNNYNFPSKYLHDFKSDGRRMDIYHGESIDATEKDAVITANIPLDPIEGEFSYWRLRLKKVSNALQLGLSCSGVAITSVSLYIAPAWYLWVLLGFHALALYAFLRLSWPPRAKGWGIVYDDGDRRPINRVIARLFDSRFNKLVATEVTDRRGRYAFLAGESKFYVTYEHTGYDRKQSDAVDLSGKEQGAVAIDIAMIRNGQVTPPDESKN